MAFKRFKITTRMAQRKKWDLYSRRGRHDRAHLDRIARGRGRVERQEVARIKVLKTICRRIEGALDAL